MIECSCFYFFYSNLIHDLFLFYLVGLIDSIPITSTNLTEYQSEKQDIETSDLIDFSNPIQHDLLVCILLCNSCVKGENTLKSDNPDELALVYGAYSLGAVIESKEDKSVCIRFGSTREKWNILKIIPFSSDRKRMSVIVENDATKEIKLFIKVRDGVKWLRAREQMILYLLVL